MGSPAKTDSDLVVFRNRSPPRWTLNKVARVVFTLGLASCLLAGCGEDDIIRSTPLPPDLGLPDRVEVRPDLGPLLEVLTPVVDLGSVVFATNGGNVARIRNLTDRPVPLWTNIGNCPLIRDNVCLVVTGSLIAKPHQETRIPILFAPIGPVQPRNLQLTACLGPPCEFEIELIGRGVPTGFSCSTVLDFGPVAVGATRSLTGTCRNEANADVVPGEPVLVPSDVFSVTSTVPELLPAGEAFELQVEFRPTVATEALGSLYAEALEGGRVIVSPPRIELRGVGLSP